MGYRAAAGYCFLARRPGCLVVVAVNTEMFEVMALRAERLLSLAFRAQVDNMSAVQQGQSRVRVSAVLLVETCAVEPLLSVFQYFAPSSDQRCAPWMCLCRERRVLPVPQDKDRYLLVSRHY